jgi:nucleoside-diphosphate-sugar epimerase
MLGALNPVRDFTFVKDTVEGFMLVAQAASTAGQVINVGQGKGITIGALAQQIITLLGQPVEIGSETDRIRPDSSEVMELICNSDKAKRMLGWQPRYSLEEGLKATVAFIEQNPHLYTPDLFQV